MSSAVYAAKEQAQYAFIRDMGPNWCSVALMGKAFLFSGLLYNLSSCKSLDNQHMAKYKDFFFSCMEISSWL